VPEGSQDSIFKRALPAEPLLWGRLIALPATYLLVQWLWPRPAGVSPEGWQFFGIFAATIAGLMLRPLPGGAIVLSAILISGLSGVLPYSKGLEGYANPTVWLVVAAFMISRALIQTGLARRIALLFVRAFGSSSIGVSYALVLSDVTMAMVIPSNSARTGGVIMPITLSLAQLYGSHPGKTASLLGAFLMAAVYQGECVAAAMFMTGQAGNLLAADLGRQVAGVDMSWARWAMAGVVPGAVSLMGLPWIVSRLLPLEIRRTPGATDFARQEIEAMGPVSRDQKLVLIVFVGVCGLWLTSSLHGVSAELVALAGACLLLLTGVLRWDDVIRESAAWDVFVWYGGVVRLGQALNDFGVTTAFATSVGNHFVGLDWTVLIILVGLIYFYAHYGFASITGHIVSMFPPFLAVLLARGAPAGLAAFALVCGTNLAAGLTHYGTTPAPMFFALNYVSFRDWWRVGFLLSLWNIAVWSTVGVLWWKLTGIW
jgi:DASS family divalent anion:Na+ symporter